MQPFGNRIKAQDGVVWLIFMKDYGGAMNVFLFFKG